MTGREAALTNGDEFIHGKCITGIPNLDALCLGEAVDSGVTYTGSSLRSIRIYALVGEKNGVHGCNAHLPGTGTSAEHSA